MKASPNPPVIIPDDANYYQLWNATLTDVHDIWLKNYSKLYAKKTQGFLESGWKRLWPLWSREMRSIRIDEVQQILLPLSPFAQRRTKAMYAKLEHLAYGMDILDRERTGLLRTEKETYQPRSPLSQNDIDALYEHQGEWFVDITLVLCYTGFRSGEFIEIRKEDVNLPLAEITGGNKTRYGIYRVVPIHPKILPIIKRWMEFEPGEWLIGKESGARFAGADIQHAVSMATAAYCAHTHIPHECRHTFYSNLQRGDENSAACIERLMGHDPYGLPIDIGVYTHPSPDQLRRVILSLS